MLLVDPEAESADVDDPEVDGLGWRRRGVAVVDITWDCPNLGILKHLRSCRYVSDVVDVDKRHRRRSRLGRAVSVKICDSEGIGWLCNRLLVGQDV